MDDRLHQLIGAVQAFPQVQVAKGKDGVVTVAVSENLIPEKPWPEGVEFEVLQEEQLLPTVENLLSITQAVELAHEMGATATTKWDFYKDISGYTDKKTGYSRPARFEMGKDVFKLGEVYYLTREAVERRIKQRLKRSRKRVKKPTKSRAEAADKDQ